jgi:uncharacterized Zn finger protein (UPF0148 family)
MLYIKCNQCGNLNQFQNDYLVFCSKCNKKLEHNYSAWQKANPGKAKDEYIRLYCISDEEIEAQNKNKPPKKSRLAYIIGMVIVLSISATIVGIAARELVAYYTNNKLSTEIADDAWEMRTYGSLGLQIDSPYELTKIELPMPEEIKSVLLISESYSYTSINGLNIFVSSNLYSDEVVEVNLDGAINGSINEIRALEGVSNLKYQKEDIEINDHPGYRLRGSFMQNGINLNFIATGVSNDKSLHQVLVLFKTDDEKSKKAADRINKSIVIS